jgi:hypothetical protein
VEDSKNYLVSFISALVQPVPNADDGVIFVPGPPVQLCEYRSPSLSECLSNLIELFYQSPPLHAGLRPVVSMETTNSIQHNLKFI